MSMKKILFLTLLCAFTLILAITSCSNNDYEETINAKMSKSRITRAASSSFTMEEVEERLRLIGEKYGTKIHMKCIKDYHNITEDLFVQIEKIIAYRMSDDSNSIEDLQITNNSYSLIDDNSINEINIASTSNIIENSNPYLEDEWEFSFNCGLNHKHNYCIKFNCKNERVKAEFTNLTEMTETHSTECHSFYGTNLHIGNASVSFHYSFTISSGYFNSTETTLVDGVYSNGIVFMFESGYKRHITFEDK